MSYIQIDSYPNVIKFQSDIKEYKKYTYQGDTYITYYMRRTIGITEHVEKAYDTNSILRLVRTHKKTSIIRLAAKLKQGQHRYERRD